MENVAIFLSLDSKAFFFNKDIDFMRLLHTAGFTPKYVFSQSEDRFSSSTYIGKGKLQEISDFIHSLKENQEDNISYLILNIDVNSLQKRRIEEATGLIVIDRTSLVLYIFEANAKTRESILQVEIAKFMYMKSQLIDDKASYAQVTGGTRRARGSGEKKLEINKRTLDKVIYAKQKELEEIKNKRKNMRVKRNNSSLPNIVIVGYTNAGKSTLINSLLDFCKRNNDKHLLSQDELFATLETSTRLISAYGYPSFLLTDTVGFIDKLPTTLIDAFRSTLEEIKEADLLIHVIDVSDFRYFINQHVTDEILLELGVKDIPSIYLFNKADLINGVPFLPKEDQLFTSLIDPEDTKGIMEFICQSIAKDWEKKIVFVPFGENFAQFLSDNYVENYKEKEDGYECVTYLNPRTLHKYSYLFKS